MRRESALGLCKNELSVFIWFNLSKKVWSNVQKRDGRRNWNWTDDGGYEEKYYENRNKIEKSEEKADTAKYKELTIAKFYGASLLWFQRN